MTNIYYILPNELSQLHAQLEQAKEGIDFSDYVNLRIPLEVKDGIATISIQGFLKDKAPKIYKNLGCTDYRDVKTDIGEALAQGAKGILFKIDSGGGTVAGCQELAEVMENLPVPAVTFFDGLGCSAAYKTGCGTDYIVSSPSAQVGNIGTILAYMDDSKLMEKFGLSIVTITNEEATLKDTFHKLPLTDEQKEFLQVEINEAGQRFINHVKNNRQNIDEEVFKAGWYSGEKAVQLGLVDEIGTEETARERLNELVTLTSNILV